MSGQIPNNEERNQVPPNQYIPPQGYPGAQFAEPPPPNYMGPPTQTDGGVGMALLITLGVLIVSFFLPWYLSLVISLGIVIWATIEASSLQFRKYRLGGPAGGVSTFFSCLLLWIIGFPWFLVNRYRVRNHRAELKQPGEKTRASTIVLMVIAILFAVILPFLAIIAAIAIPNLMQSRMRANEATAITVLKSYATAQITYSVANRRESKGYCDNFRNLHYGRGSSGEQLLLISKSAADAFAGPPTGSPTSGDAPTSPIPYQGYVFLEDPSLGPDDWANDFALVAYPIEPGKTGSSIYLIDTEGTVFVKWAEADATGKPVLLKPGESPFGGNTVDWLEF